MTLGTRLRPEDEANLLVEDRGAPMHIAALAVLGAPPDGRPLDVEAVRRLVANRVPSAPALRSGVIRSGRGWRWSEAPSVDPVEHVVVRRIGEEDDALAAAAALALEAPLDRSRPLWQLVLLIEPSGACAGLLLRIHHALADGGAAVALLGSLFELGEQTAATPRRTRVRRGVLRGLGQDLRMLLGAGDALPVDVPVGRRRRLVLLHADLEDCRLVARAAGARIDDLLLAAAAEGMRALLRARGLPIRPATLRVSVAASLRPPGAAAAGNRSATVVVPVPLDEADPIRRLRRTADADAAARTMPLPRPMGRALQRWTARAMFRQRLVHLLLTNVPGPPTAARCAGVPVLELLPVPVVQGDLPIAVGALSYAGGFGITLLADRDAVPDLEVFEEGFRAGLAALGVDTEVAARRRPVH